MNTQLLKFKLLGVFFFFFKINQIDYTNYYLNLKSDEEEYVKAQRPINFIAYEDMEILSFFHGYNSQFFSFFSVSLPSTIIFIFKRNLYGFILKSNILIVLKRISQYNPNKINYKKLFFLPGFFDIFKKFKITLISASIAMFFLIILIYNHSISFQKVFALWVLGFSNIYWLFSTFVFFKKKYHWSRFTSANQKFWKRTLLLFWVLEFFLFLIFLYLTLNANNESRFMLDQIQIYKEYLYPVRALNVNLFIYFSLVFITYILTLSLKWQNSNRINGLFLFVSYLLLIIFFNECYQFFHIVNHYSNVDWEYDFDMEVWTLELESRKERTYHHYMLLLLILKFWHVVFIVSVWFFFLLRGLEIKRFYYPSLSGNLNNFIFLYIFSWLPLIGWIKYILSYIFTYSLSEFFLQIRSTISFFFFFDFFLINLSLIPDKGALFFLHHPFVYQPDFNLLND